MTENIKTIKRNPAVSSERNQKIKHRKSFIQLLLILPDYYPTHLSTNSQSICKLELRHRFTIELQNTNIHKNIVKLHKHTF